MKIHSLDLVEGSPKPLAHSSFSISYMNSSVSLVVTGTCASTAIPLQLYTNGSRFQKTIPQHYFVWGHQSSLTPFGLLPVCMPERMSDASFLLPGACFCPDALLLALDRRNAKPSASLLGLPPSVVPDDAGHLMSSPDLFPMSKPEPMDFSLYFHRYMGLRL